MVRANQNKDEKINARQLSLLNTNGRRLANKNFAHSPLEDAELYPGKNYDLTKVAARRKPSG